MIEVYRMELIGMPKSQARPVTLKAGYTFSPKTNWFKALYGKAREAAPKYPLDSPVQLDIEYIFFRTPSVPDRRYWKDTKPDIDNLEKVIMDALKNAGWYAEDSRVCKTVQLKRFADDEEIPGVKIAMRELSHETRELRHPEVK